jgi:selenocysteine lyase/cysteine desulfurase
VIGATALSAALDLLDTYGMREAENNIISNSRYFINALAERGFNSPLLYESDKNIAGIVSFYSSRAKEIYNILTGYNISCSLREGFIRFSPHFYNSKADIDKVIMTIDKELLQ